MLGRCTSGRERGGRLEQHGRFQLGDPVLLVACRGEGRCRGEGAEGGQGRVMLGHASQGLEARAHDAVVGAVVPPNRGGAVDHEAASVDHLCEAAGKSCSSAG